MKHLSRLLGILLLALVALPAAPAAAQTGQATFGVRPATATKPDERSAFTYSATPGARITDHVAVSNVSASPLTLKVYASDAFNTAEGGFDLLAGTRAPVDVGAWTTLSATEVTIPGRSVEIVPFTVEIPANATPGDHVGGVVASLATEATGGDGQRVAIEQRVGARIYLRVSGALTPSLGIEDLTADYSGDFFGRGQTRVSYTVRNTGNVRLAGAQQVTVSTPWGAEYAAEGEPVLSELLPGNTHLVTVVVPEVLPAGWLTATVRLEPVAPPATEPGPIPVEASTSTAAIPWLVVAVLGAALLLVLFLIWRRRGRVRPTSAPEPTPEVARAGA